MEPVKGLLKPWRLFLPIFWMLIIFFLSGEAFSSLHTSRFILPLLHSLWPDLPSSTLIQIHAFLRKAGHFLEYLLLSYLWYWSLLPRWSRGKKPSLVAFSLSLAYALLDEIHQSLLPSRSGSPRDVLLDGAGAFLVPAITWFRQRREETRARAGIINERGGRGS